MLNCVVTARTETKTLFKMKLFQIFGVVVLALSFISADTEIKTGDVSLDISPRITNARRAEVGQFPWHALLAIQYHNDNTNRITFCGAAILNELWILTSADCVHNARSIRADLGHVNINRPAISVFPDTSFIHPQYNPNRFINNLALLRMPTNRPISFPSGPRPAFWPIRLPARRQQTTTFENTDAFFTGYGYTSANARNVSDVLMFAEGRIISNGACLNQYGNDQQLISPAVICAQSYDSRQGACNGDGGAPLAINEFGAWTLIGTLSFLHSKGSCGRQTAAGAFTRITSHFDWIGRTAGYQFRP